MFTFLRVVAPAMVLALALTGCSSMKPYMQSPQYDEATNRFQHPAGYRNDKGVLDVLGLAGRFLTRETDPAERDGFPLLDPSAHPYFPAPPNFHRSPWVKARNLSSAIPALRRAARSLTGGSARGSSVSLKVPQ